MQERVDIGSVALEALRARITGALPAQIRLCVEELSEEQLWWRPNGQSNSVGNLVLHVCGAVMHFLCRGVGGMEYERDRAAEFAAEGSLTKQQLLALFDDMVERADETFAALDSSHLGKPSTAPDYYSIVFEDLFGVAVHLATHTGQIVYVTKMLKENSLDDLWTQTHKHSGVWKP